MYANHTIKLGVSALCLALALCACDREDTGQAGAAGQQMPATRVTVTEMTPQSVILTSEMAGRTVSSRWAEVRPEVSGIIREFSFKEGSLVNEGDVLYLIDPDTYQAAYDSAKASLAKAEANLNVSRLTDQRTSQLYKTRSVSQQDYDDARAALLQAQAEVDAARAALRTAEINLDRTRVCAPISGRIGKSSVTVGALVTANQATALASIYQNAPMNVDLTQSVDELRALYQQVNSGLEGPAREPEGVQALVRLRLSDGTEYNELGVLRFADARVDEGTGTVTLRAEFPNESRELLPGMFVRAVVNMGIKTDALLAPQQAVLRDSRGNPFVFVAVPGEGGALVAERRGISLGALQGDAWLVRDGLKPGDRVVVGGAHSVRPGGQVTIVTDAELEAQAAARRGALEASADISETGVAGGQA